MPDSHSLALLTKRETAERLRISVRTVERYIDAGTIRAIKLPGGGVRILSADIDAFVESLS